MDSSAITKGAVRNELLARRRALPGADVAVASRAIVSALRSLPELAGAQDVLLYAADPDEVALDALMLAPPDGWRILLPRVVAGAIVPVPHRPDAPLVTGHRGIREPIGDPVAPTVVSAVVVPGVAFTVGCARLGRGAGMYDRLLPGLGSAVRIGVCMERFVQDALPLEPHDAAVDVLVTDASVRRRAGAPAPGPA
jgi:5-formyltetrahydrofolate cyclo-ligase